MDGKTDDSRRDGGNSGGGIKLLAGASFVLLMGSLFFNFYLLGKIQGARGQAGASGMQAHPAIATKHAENGVVHTLPGKSGTVYFPEPFASPPYVQLHQGGLNKTIITAVTNTSFSWQNSGNNDTFDDENVDWNAQGIQ